MSDECLEGVIAVSYGGSNRGDVFLEHKVYGRFSQMELNDGDTIQVKDGDHYQTVTVEQILETTSDGPSYKSNRGRLELFTDGSQIAGRSLYDGALAKVQLNSRVTQTIQAQNRRIFLDNLFFDVAREGMTYEEAMEALERWEKAYEM